MSNTIDTIRDIVPDGVLLFIGLLLVIGIYTKGNDPENPDQDLISKVFFGTFGVILELAKLALEIFEASVNGASIIIRYFQQQIIGFKRWASQNVSIQIHFDGRFWTLLIILVLIGLGYLGWSALEF